MNVIPSPVPDPTRGTDLVDTATPGVEPDESLTETEKFILEMLERLDAADAEAEHLRRALAHSRDIGAAIGILMSSRKVTREGAVQLLREASQNHNQKLQDLALDVMSTGELPSSMP